MQSKLLAKIALLFIGASLSLKDVSIVKYNKTIAMRECYYEIVTGRIRTDSHGVVRLPKRTSHLSLNGFAYRTVTMSGLDMVLFPTWRGRDANIEGYLITNRKLNRHDTYLDRYGKMAIDKVLIPEPANQKITIPLTGEVSATRWAKIYRFGYYMD